MLLNLNRIELFVAVAKHHSLGKTAREMHVSTSSVCPSIEKLVRESEVDIAIIHSPAQSSDFTLEHFAVDNLTFFAHPMHPLAKKKDLDLADLAETPLIVREGRDATHKMLKE